LNAGRGEYANNLTAGSFINFSQTFCQTFCQTVCQTPLHPAIVANRGATAIGGPVPSMHQAD